MRSKDEVQEMIVRVIDNVNVADERRRQGRIDEHKHRKDTDKFYAQLALLRWVLDEDADVQP